MKTTLSSESRELAREKRETLESISGQLRDDIERLGDPKGQALFETAAEVLDGLGKAFEHYAEQSEKAWR